MAKWQSSDLKWRGQVELDDEFIELSELDFDDLPPTDPVGIRPRLPPRPQRNAEFARVRPRLRTPVCVEFEDDRIVDLTPPPVVGNSSIAPTSASLPPQQFKRDNAPSSPSRWSLPIVALSATIAIGIIAYRVTDKTAAFAPSSPAAVQPAAVIPSFAPDDFPVFEDPAEDKVEWTWIDLSNAPREDWPPSGNAPGTVSVKPAARSTSAAVVDKKESASPIGDPTGEEIAPKEAIAEPPAAGRAFDQDEASASLSAAAGSAIACRGDAPSGFAKVAVTFAPSGRVTTAVVDGPYAGTMTGGCIAKTFRSARVQPFDGSLVTVRKTVILK